MFRADFLPFTSKIVEHSRYLPRPARSDEHSTACPPAAAVEAAQVEVHRRERLTFDYRAKPLAAFSRGMSRWSNSGEHPWRGEGGPVSWSRQTVPTSFSRGLP